MTLDFLQFPLSVSGALTVSGAVNGALTVKRSVLSGTLAGRRLATRR